MNIQGFSRKWWVDQGYWRYLITLAKASLGNTCIPHQGIWTLPLDWELTRWNPCFRKITGSSMEKWSKKKNGGRWQLNIKQINNQKSTTNILKERKQWPREDTGIFLFWVCRGLRSLTPYCFHVENHSFIKNTAATLFFSTEYALLVQNEKSYFASKWAFERNFSGITFWAASSKIPDTTICHQQ